MKKENLDDLFETLNGEFDVENPGIGHENRFLSKLKSDTSENSETEKTKGINWKSFLAIAASIIICLSVFVNLNNNEEELMDLANVSPELSETQDFFTATIENELRKLNKEQSPITKKIIEDALVLIDNLENDYNTLKIELTQNCEDQRIIHAMISNFQSRIDILNTVLEEIENIKQLKTDNNETNNTI
ncbi:MAG: hypothetical protein HRU50_11375 [Winogradskyella sp.]|uniref:hypothetical protein n=1 Tax=Winogradskyella sp. TaxID=1883156 RepID=UPI0025EFCE0C|nr:hypothetical protein [Winogradskyella sp.]NRB60523.1 hypothetical protein [Winogradskyella sp.]